MNFYAFVPDANGNPPMGTEKQMISRGHYKTLKGFLKHAVDHYNGKPLMIYSFTNFYDCKTFKLLYERRPANSPIKL